jgi:hypothetical protein
MRFLLSGATLLVMLNILPNIQKFRESCYDSDDCHCDIDSS